MPDNATTYDAVRVGRNNNPQKYYTEVFTYRDKDGNIVAKQVRKIDDKDTVETKKWYEDLGEDYVDYDPVTNIETIAYAKRARSYTRTNGKISKIAEESLTQTFGDKPTVTTKFKREIVPSFDEELGEEFPCNIETIQLEQREKGKEPKVIKNKYRTNHIDNESFELLESKASSPELESIAQNSYFLPYVSKQNKFIHRMAQACINDQHFLFPPRVHVFKKASNQRGRCTHSGHVYINTKSESDKNSGRGSLTSTIGHEIGHAKWDERCRTYDTYNQIGINPCDMKDLGSIEEIEKYKKARANYVHGEEDFQKYFNNFTEVTAREEGRKAFQKYEDLEEKINEEFPNKHINQFYTADKDEDMMQSLLDSIFNG